MTGDFLDVLFRIRGHFNELIARFDPDSDGGADALAKLQQEVDKVSEAINQLVEKGFHAPLDALAEANAKLEGLNHELAAARVQNEKLKIGLDIAARVLGVIAQAASFTF